MPVSARIQLNSTEFMPSSTIRLPCEVRGFPTPVTTWYKEDQVIEVSEKYQIEGEARHSTSFHCFKGVVVVPRQILKLPTPPQLCQEQIDPSFETLRSFVSWISMDKSVALGNL